MSNQTGRLFSPIAIGTLTINGRLIKTATAETRASEDGFVTDDVLAFYRPIALGGTPLIITGNIYVSRDGKSSARQLAADADDKIDGLARLTGLAHEHGCRIFAQLNHCGRQVLPAAAGLAEAVSASARTELVTGTRPRALTGPEVERMAMRFAEAAERCKRAGFDGVQIHAAHGYLMNQFLTPYTNRRADAYGGSLEGRSRLLCETIRATRARVGPDYPLIVKLNGADDLPLRHGLKTAELVAAAALLEREGIDAVEISVGHYESGFPMVRGTFGRCLRNMVRGSMRHLPFLRRWIMRLTWPALALAFNVLWRRREGFNLPYAPAFKQRLRIPVICVGGFRSRRAMEEALSRGLCDIVSAGRAFVADPLLYAHLRDGISGPVCVDCNACVGHLGARPLDCYHPRVRAQKDAMLAPLASG
jgi:2,4-dienoyl-CoA reductase-like NADH-dependent reductase (Old Yellow Enzyme family)